MNTKLRVAGCLVMMLAAPAVFSQAQEQPNRFTIWDIHLGDTASAIPDEYINYACGTNGGPPSLPLPNFAAFKKCKPEADGLREVYFEYDDEQRIRGTGDRQNRAGDQDVCREPRYSNFRSSHPCCSMNPAGSAANEW